MKHLVLQINWNYVHIVNNYRHCHIFLYIVVHCYELLQACNGCTCAGDVFDEALRLDAENAETAIHNRASGRHSRCMLQ